MKGFTLVEILVSAMILSFLAAGMFMVLHIGTISSGADLGLLDLQQQARLAMDGMTRELRHADIININSPCVSPSSITFNAPSGINPTTWTGPITYQLDINQNQILRLPDAATGLPQKVIGNYVNNLIFCLNGDILTIRFTCQKTVRQRNLTVSLDEQVRLRNE
jgi:prepilin-type N-terminal cleavage/methylation domain-containing protein